MYIVLYYLRVIYSSRLLSIEHAYEISSYVAVVVLTVIIQECFVVVDVSYSFIWKFAYIFPRVGHYRKNSICGHQNDQKPGSHQVNNDVDMTKLHESPRNFW